MTFTSDNQKLSTSLLHRKVDRFLLWHGVVARCLNMISKRTVVMLRQGDDPGLNTISASQRSSRIVQKKPSTHKTTIWGMVNTPRRLGLSRMDLTLGLGTPAAGGSGKKKI